MTYLTVLPSQPPVPDTSASDKIIFWGRYINLWNKKRQIERFTAILS